jgi:hypothetical protein
MHYLLKQGISSHLRVILKNVKQAGETDKVPVNIFQNVS